MSQTSRQEVLKRIHYHYRKISSRKAKGQLLQALQRLTGWNRKHAIKQLKRDPARPPKVERRGGPRNKYGAAEISLLKVLWLASGQLCGKRLVPVLECWLKSWERRHGEVEAAVRAKVLQISAAQADRLLARHKVKGGGAVRPGCEVRRQIPIRTGPWAVSAPGWIEADSVAHCGGSLRGSHGWSVVFTDIFSGWTQAGMSWNRNHLNVQRCIQRIEAELPFTIIGFDSDNGGESERSGDSQPQAARRASVARQFINAVLLDYWRKQQQSVEVTRSRPYRKNDNAHVEQKNRALIREHLGHERIDTTQAVSLFDQALKLISLRANLYQASAKLVGKERPDPQSKPRKVYEKRARTPWERLMQSESLSAGQRGRLEKMRHDNDPIELNEQIEAKLRQAWQALQQPPPAAEIPPVEPEVRWAA